MELDTLCDVDQQKQSPTKDTSEKT